MASATSLRCSTLARAGDQPAGADFDTRPGQQESGLLERHIRSIGQMRSLGMARSRLVATNGQPLATATQPVVVAERTASAGRDNNVRAVPTVADLVRTLARLPFAQLGFRQSATRLRAGKASTDPIHRGVHEVSDPSLIAGADTSRTVAAMPRACERRCPDTVKSTVRTPGTALDRVGRLWTPRPCPYSKSDCPGMPGDTVGRTWIIPTQ